MPSNYEVCSIIVIYIMGMSTGSALSKLSYESKKDMRYGNLQIGVSILTFICIFLIF